jgi:hypothetical protein
VRFLNPSAFILILFLLLLLLAQRRRTRTRVRVGNLFLWREAIRNETATLTRRIRRHWLLILQTACLIAIIVALARPMISGGDLVAIVLDTSLSMSAAEEGGTRLDAGRRQAQSLLQELPRGSRVRVVIAGPEPRSLGEFARRDAAIDALRTATATDSGSDLSAAIRLAGGNRPPDAIYVISDADRTRITESSAPNVTWIGIGSPRDNVAITNLGTRLLEEHPDVVQIAVGVTNYGADAPDARLILTIDDAPVEERVVALPAASTSSYVFNASNVRGVLTARLEHADALAADNVRHLAVAGAEKVRVYLSGQSGRPIEAALRTHPDVVFVSSVEDADVFVCDGLPTEARGEKAGCVDPPDSSDALLVTSALNQDRAQIGARQGLDAGLTPILRDLNTGGPLPAVEATEENGRRVIEIALDAEATTWVFSPQFPVLISNALEWLTEGSKSVATFAAGEPLRLRMPDSGVAPTVSGPGSRTIVATLSGGYAVVADTAAAGIYRVRSGDREQIVAINPATASESDLGVSADVLPKLSSLPEPAARRDNDALAPIVIIALLLLAAEWHYRWSGASAR